MECVNWIETNTVSAWIREPCPSGRIDRADAFR